MSIGDTLFHFTEWLRTTQLPEFTIWISNTKPSLWIGTHFWATPIFQVIHILAISAAFGSVLMINMRILGLRGGTHTLTATARRYVPWIWWSLLALLFSGICMCIGEPIRELVNPVFWIKMGAVITMVLVSLWFQASIRRNMATWEITHDGRVAIRFGAVAIILLWCFIMVCGRWIAYAPV